MVSVAAWSNAGHVIVTRRSAIDAIVAHGRYQRDRKPDQSHASREAECQTVARWADGAAMDGRRRVLEAEKGFRRLKGHKDMPKLVAALRARDHQLGIAASVENVA